MTTTGEAPSSMGRLRCAGSAGGPASRRASHPASRLLPLLAAAPLLAAVSLPAADTTGAAAVPILLYHRVSPTAADPMTVSLPIFESQLEYLKDRGYRVIPLQRLLDWLRGAAPPPPPRSVVITIDDGHRSVHERMLPLLQRYGHPATLFIYPSAIDNAVYALTWDQLRELRASGLFDIQSHTYWHPHFPRERRSLAPAAYAKLVDTQLTRSREKLERETGGEVTLLAWPFGLYDGDLSQRAAAVGYQAAFTLERRHARPGDDPMALPRYLVTDLDRGERFGRLLAAGETRRPGNR